MKSCNDKIRQNLLHEKYMTVSFDGLDLALKDLYGEIATIMIRIGSSKYQNYRYIYVFQSPFISHPECPVSIVFDTRNDQSPLLLY